MAVYYARKAGNINATDVWATTPSGTAGAQTFAAGDVLVANSFAITVNVSTNLGNGTVTNDNRDGATAGGSFALSDGVTLTANVVAGAASCVNYNGSSSAAIVGNVTGGTANFAYGVQQGGGSLSITGTVSTGTGPNSSGWGSASANSTGALTVTGNVVAGAGGAGMNTNSVIAVTVTGNVTGGAGPTSHGITLSGVGGATIIGTATGGLHPSAAGVANSGTGTATIVGTAVGAVGAGANNSSTGTMTVTRARGGPLAASNVGVNGSATGSTSVSEIEFGDLGASPVSGPIRLSDNATNVAVFYRFGTTKKTLVDANASGLMPTASNVRFGTVYSGGNSTGTMRVPAAGSVALGVPVDNTTGTAALTPAAVWAYATASATTAGSMGERLANAATVASTGQQLSDALSN